MNEKEKGSEKKTGGRRKKSLARKRARETLSEESAKKQKLEDDAAKATFLVSTKKFAKLEFHSIVEDAFCTKTWGSVAEANQSIFLIDLIRWCLRILREDDPR
ncbi:hypothetical protein Tco_1311469 [Tanacetum coccineum]